MLELGFSGSFVPPKALKDPMGILRGGQWWATISVSSFLLVRGLDADAMLKSLNHQSLDQGRSSSNRMSPKCPGV